jgi:hypothetical protein
VSKKYAAVCNELLENDVFSFAPHLSRLHAPAYTLHSDTTTIIPSLYRYTHGSHSRDRLERPRGSMAEVEPLMSSRRGGPRQ